MFIIAAFTLKFCNLYYVIRLGTYPICVYGIVLYILGMSLVKKYGFIEMKGANLWPRLI